jgi:TP901 family phage tail tape measure protein
MEEIYQIYANMQTSAEEIYTMAQPTAILANLSGEDASTAADQIQAVINQFDMTADDAMHIADVYDKVSASIAVDYSKGIEGMAAAVENVGNVAYQAGLSFEQLSSIIAKTMEQTRQDGSSLGNSMKTILTRLSKASTMSDEVSNEDLSNASKALNEIGIKVYETSGEFREFDTIMSELAEKWDTLTDAQQANISYQIAATRQVCLYVQKCA